MKKQIRMELAVLLLMNLLQVGCQSKPSGQPELGQVTGKITMDGNPLTNAAIYFSPSDGRGSIGTTDTSGSYVLGYLPKILGAKVGKHKVTIKTFWNDEASPEAQFTKEQIPAKYNSETSLSADVKPGKNVFDFDLTTK